MQLEIYLLNTKMIVKWVNEVPHFSLSTPVSSFVYFHWPPTHSCSVFAWHTPRGVLNTSCTVCVFIIHTCDHADLMSVHQTGFWLCVEWRLHTLQSSLMCELRCRGQMYGNQNSAFPQWWDRFVKRLMCPNPVKDLGWVRAAAPMSWGRESHVFLTEAYCFSSRWAHMILTCWACVLKEPWANGFPDRLQHAHRPNKRVLLSPNQDFGASSQDILAATISALNKNKHLKHGLTLSWSQIDGKSCWTWPTSASKWRSPLDKHLLDTSLTLIILYRQSSSQFIDDNHVTFYSGTQSCGLHVGHPQTS